MNLLNVVQLVKEKEDLGISIADPDFIDGESRGIKFSDGTAIVAVSGGTNDYGDNTPGDPINPPQYKLIPKYNAKKIKRSRHA